MKQNELINELVELGLSSREAKVYFTLVKYGLLGATDIPKYSAVPRTKIYEVLQRLVQKGFCSEIYSNKRSKGKKYQAVDPSLAIQGVINQQEKHINLLKEKASNSVETLSDIYSKSDNIDKYEFVQVVKSSNKIMETFLHLKANIKEEYLEFGKGPFIASEAVNKKEAEEFAGVIKKGVTVKIIYEENVIETPYYRQIANDNLRAGVQVRVVKELPIKIALFDTRSVLMLMLDPILLEPLPTATFIEHPGLAETLRTSFYTYWKNGKPLSKK